MPETAAAAGAMTLKLLVIDDHPLIRTGVAVALQELAQHVHVTAVSDAEEGLAAVEANPDFDAALLDLALPGMHGFLAIREFRMRFPSLPVVVLSALEALPNVRRALKAGATGFIPKSAPPGVMLDALREILAGGVYVPPVLEPIARTRSDPLSETARVGAAAAGQLTLRQIEVLSSICRGKGNGQIAGELGLSEKTVKTHITAIFRVLGVSNRTQAVLAARRMGLLND